MTLQVGGQKECGGRGQWESPVRGLGLPFFFCGGDGDWEGSGALFTRRTRLSLCFARPPSPCPDGSQTHGGERPGAFPIPLPASPSEPGQCQASRGKKSFLPLV